MCFLMTARRINFNLDRLASHMTWTKWKWRSKYHVYTFKITNQASEVINEIYYVSSMEKFLLKITYSKRFGPRILQLFAVLQRSVITQREWFHYSLSIHHPSLPTFPKCTSVCDTSVCTHVCTPFSAAPLSTWAAMWAFLLSVWTQWRHRPSSRLKFSGNKAGAFGQRLWNHRDLKHSLLSWFPRAFITKYYTLSRLC